jgi:hypothetical protein
MSKVNVNIPSPQVFGKKLPRVFIDRIEIQDFSKSDGDFRAGYEYYDHAKIVAYLNIRFSKPAHIQYETARDFITNQLDGLYLHAYTSFLNQFNDKLENNVFNLKDFLDWREGKNESEVRSRINLAEEYGQQFSDEWFLGTSERYRNESAVGVNAYEIKLSDLVSEDEVNIYNSSISFTNSFDSEGNEIVQISNIVLTFTHKPFFAEDIAVTLGQVLPKIGNIDRLFGLFTVGPKLETLDTPTFDETVSQTTSVNTFNSYFGDITYYQILQNGKIPNRFYSSYFEQDSDVPYYGPVFMGLNGDFYKTESFSIQSLRTRFQELITKYEPSREADSRLNSNISSLEAIIYADNNTSNVLGELSNYRSVYPDKSQEFKSGEFYNEFVILFSDIVLLIQSMPKLVEKVLYDSLVVDTRARPGLYDPSVFRKAGIPISALVSGAGDDRDSDDYISKKWFQISRRAYIRDTAPGAGATTAGGAFGDLLDDLLPGDSGARRRAIAAERRFGEGTADSSSGGGEYADLLNQFVEVYEAAGYSSEDALELAESELEFQLRAPTEDSFGGTERGLFDLTRASDSAIYTELTDEDFVVNNFGYFFFDYEKAVRTTSDISNYLNLSKLQKYFRFNVPYQHYQIKKVTLSRNELLLEADDVIASEAAEKTVDFKIESTLQSGVSGKFPKSKINQYSLDASNAANEAGAAADPISKLRYGRPFVSVNNQLRYSYVKFINFDVANSNISRRLEGVGRIPDMTNYTDTQTVGDGYRLACFEFSDFMDDNVAYKNTIFDFDDALGFSILSNRQEALKIVNNDSPVTNYKVLIQCEDNTLETYIDFRNEIKKVYDTFKAYAELSDEICSYNNITNSFNQFFIDGITEAYGDSRPWIEAAYVYVAMRDLLFGDLQALEPLQLDNQVTAQLISIAPETGTNEGVQSMLKEFCTIIRSMYSSVSGGGIPTDEAKPDLIEGAQSGFDGIEPSRIHFDSYYYGNNRYFRNRIPILAKIAGEYFPDDTSLGMFEVRGPPPTPLFSEASFSCYFDGATTIERRMGPNNPYARIPEGEGAFPSKYIAYAFEEIFYPVDGLGSFLDNMYTDRITTRRITDSFIPDSIYGYPPDTSITYIKFILDRIFQRSTVDANVELRGAYYLGTAKAGGRSTEARRAFRTLNAAISLLEVYEEEVNRRLLNPSARFGPNNIKVTERTFDTYTSGTYTESETSESGALAGTGRTKEFILGSIKQRIIECIALLKNYKSFYTTSEYIGDLTEFAGFGGLRTEDREDIVITTEISGEREDRDGDGLYDVDADGSYIYYGETTLTDAYTTVAIDEDEVRESGATLGDRFDPTIYVDTFKVFNEDDPIGGVFNTAVFDEGSTPSFTVDEDSGE